MINVIAIDDEPLALLQIKKMIELTPYFNLVAACSSAFEAMSIMENNEVDAIFADINMPDLSGIDFVRSLVNPPIIVFTTAYSQYAIDGYKVNAIDYLLKPFGQSEFQHAANKVKQQYELLHTSRNKETAVQQEEAEPTTEEMEGRIEGDILFVKSDYRLVRISISDIRYIESQSEYLRLYMANGTKIMVLQSIKHMAEILPKDRFIRIHRSYIVNMAHVVEISRLRIRMDAETLLPVGDSYKDEVLEYVNSRIVGK